MDAEARAWIGLVVGVTLVAAIESLLGPVPAGFSGPLAAAAGYAAWRLIPPPPRRGPPKYWRGRAHWD